MDNVIRHLRRAVARSGFSAATDAELLERFVAYREEDAFAMLVRRHGPMVLGVCLRVLHHRQDAEDAFQATFLTLVRKGTGIRERDALASWLYRVAFRAALRLKSGSVRRAADAITDVPVCADPGQDAAWRELRPVLDTEVQRLPAKYRAPIVLCYLEGKSYEEAATALGCPKGTVAIRLLRGKLLLKNRLARRGFVLSAGLVATQATLPAAQALVPPLLASSIGNAAAAVAAGSAISSATTATVAALVGEVARSFWIRRVQTAAICLVSLGLAGTGAGGLASAYRATQASIAPTNEVAAANTPPSMPAKVAAPERVEPPPTALVQAEPPPAAAPTPEPDARGDGIRSVLVIQVTARFEIAGAGDTCQRRPAERGRCGSMSRSREVMNPACEAKAARSGLAVRETLNDEVTPTPAVEIGRFREAAIAGVWQIGPNACCRIIVITETGQIFIFTPA